MGKSVKTFLTLLLCLLMTVNVYADEAGKSQKPDLVTDYYMIVESPDGGVDLYAGAGFDEPKLNNEQIPNGTALHIEGEKTDENQRVWGYTQYRGMYGYVPEDDLKPATKSEAIESELYLAGADNVDYNADYDVEPRDDAGTASLYQGPGEKYGTVLGGAEIPDGSRLHVYEDANMADGSHWAHVETEDGTDGWVNMDQMKPYGTADGDNAVVNMEQSQTEEAQNAEVMTAGNADLTPTPSVIATPTPKPTATPAPEATATPEPTKEPTPTAEPTAEPTEEPTPTAEPTEEATPTEEAEEEEPTPTAEPTEEPTPTEETVDADDAETKEASGSEVESVESLAQSPFIWIIIVVILAVIILLVYHFKKRDK